MIHRLQRIIDSGYSQSLEGLSTVRLLYVAVLLTMILPLGTWVSAQPDLFLFPPPGIPRLLTQVFGGAPPAWYFLTLNAVCATAGVLMLYDRWMRGASIVVFFSLLFLESGSFIFGKIDHNILFVTMPLLFAFAGVNSPSKPRPHASYWLFVWATFIACCMLTAAIPKVTSGWLSTQTQSVQGYTLTIMHNSGKDGWLATQYTTAGLPWWYWEAQDWATILLEGGLIFLLLTPRLFRIGLCIACLFHVAVFFSLEIFFFSNLVAYAALINWSGIGYLSRLNSSCGKISTAIQTAGPIPAVMVALGVGFVFAFLKDSPIDTSFALLTSDPQNTWVVQAMINVLLGLAVSFALFSSAWTLTFGRWLPIHRKVS